MRTTKTKHPSGMTARVLGPVVLLLLGSMVVGAAPGDLDVSFGSSGTAITVLASDDPYLRSLVIQPDGKSLAAVAAGWYGRLVLVRHNADGTLDTTFNGTGKVVADFDVFVAGSVALQTDGKILALGDTVLARYDANGSLDTIFNGTGKVTTRCVNEDYPEAMAYFGPTVAVQADGKILVAGQRPSAFDNHEPDFYVARYDTGGGLDASFGVGGEVQTNIAEHDGSGSHEYPVRVLVQNDGKIVVAGFSWGIYEPGTEFVVVRYTADGSLDPGFGAGGIVITDICTDDRTYAAALQADGKILLGVSLGGGAGVLRYNSAGTLDSGFGTGGVVELYGGSIGYPDSVDSLALQGNGKIAVGLAHPCSVARLNPNGSLDTTFNGTGVKRTLFDCEDEGAVALQRDGKIIEARGVYQPPSYYEYDLGLARYEGDFGTALAVVSGAAGTPVAGEPTGTYLSSIGLPALNKAAELAFKGTLKFGRTATPAVLAGAAPAVVARKGAEAPGAFGATFASFKDPVLNQAGEVAFVARLAGAGVVAANDWGLWSDAFGSGLQLVEREGDAAAGGGGTWFASFANIALDTGAGMPWVAFVAKLAGPGVTAANDCGLWSYNAGVGTRLLLREEATMDLDGTPRVLRGFKVLGKTALASGQGFVLSEGAMTALLTFTDGTVVVATVYADGSAPVAVAIKNGDAPGYDPGALFGSFAGQGQNSLGEAVFRAGIRGAVSKDANAAIYAVTGGGGGGGGGALERVAVKGEEAPGVAGTTFTSFAVAVANWEEMVAFKGKVVGGGITDTNNTGLWLWHEDATELLHREDDEAAGVAGGARWDKFTELALPDGLRPLFLARLLVGSGTPAVTAADDLGLWAVDASGTTCLLVREGVTIVAGKTVKSFRALCAPSGSQGQTRSHNGVGGIVYWAQFTDGTQGIVTVQIP